MSVRVALALGSGGARGYAHIGVIQALQERDVEIVGIAGSSMGAVVGGALAAGELDAFTQWVRGLSQRDVLRQLDLSPGSAGMIRAERVIATMVSMIGDRRIEELPVRFTAVAVDLLAGREIWLDEGPLDRAIRASIGIPGAITPLAVNGRLLVDGGVLNPVPVAATAASHADAVVAVSLQGPRTRQVGGTQARETAEPLPGADRWDRLRANAAGIMSSDAMNALAQRFAAKHPSATGEEGDEAPAMPDVGMLETMTLSLDAAAAALTRFRLAAHPPDVLVTVPRDACRTMEFHRANELIDLGRRLADKALDDAQIDGL
jgi:NTE family protein